MRSLSSVPDPLYATSMAHRFISENNIKWLPVDTIPIASNLPNCTFMYAKDLAYKISESEEYVLSKIMHGQDGIARYYPSTKKYEIIINSNIDSLGRIHWTCLHEIGHIYLKHLSDFEQTSITRGSLPDHIYENLEYEAHIFAAEVLAPKWLMRHLGITNEDDIINLCGLSFKGAKSRLAKIDEKYSSIPVDATRLISNFSEFSKEITICQPIEKFNSPNYASLNTPLKPLKSPMPPFMKANSCCKFCGNTKDIQNANFCIMCGHALKNAQLTSTDYCGHINPSYAAFCERCGKRVYKTKQGFCLEELEI